MAIAEKPLPAQRAARATAPSPDEAVQELLDKVAPERLQRYAELRRRLGGAFRDREQVALAAAALSRRAGDEGTLAAACDASARQWRSRHGLVARGRLHLSLGEALVVSARGGAAPADIETVVGELRARRFNGETARPTMAAQILAAAPTVDARAAWYARARAAWRGLQKLHPVLLRPYAQRLLFSLVQDADADATDAVHRVERIYVQLRQRGVPSALLLTAAILLACGRVELDDERALCERFQAARKRLAGLRRLGDLGEEPALALALLTMALDDVDIPVGLILAAQRELKRRKSRTEPGLTILLVLEDLVRERPALARLVDTCGDVILRQLEARQAAIIAAS
jgi:hypothetical protein